MLNTYWINNKEANITIKLNDLCNTKCLHCFSHGKDRSFLNVTGNEKSFSIFWQELYKKGVRKFDVAFVGGEVTLLTIKEIDSILSSFYKSILLFLNNNVIDKNNEENKIFFSVSLITNFIFDLKEKKYSNYLLELSKNPTINVSFNSFKELFSLEFNVVTSYDVGLGRFKSSNIENLWINNCIFFTEPLHLLITLNKDTCLNIKSILENNFFDKFSLVCFQPMLNFTDKNSLLPSYKELYDTYHLINEYKEKHGKPYVMGWSAKPGYHVSINNDGIVSCSVSEEVKLYENKEYFNISDISEKRERFSQMLSSQVALRIKKTRNKKCLACEHYEDCNFGLELFTPLVICPAFKIIPE